MPPKKRARPASRDASVLSVASQLPTRATSTADSVNKSPTVQIQSDPWTDEQEIALFKAIIRWKPAGLHKHFRVTAISRFLQDQGHTVRNAPHTSIPGIWRKLRTLYNLDAIDERENSMFDPGDLDNAQTIPIRPFSLPKADFGAMMFSKRLASEGSSSPALLDQPVRQKTKLGARGSRIADPKARASMVEPNDEGSPKSPPPARNRPSTRSTRSSLVTPQTKVGVETRRSTGSKRKVASTRADDVHPGEPPGTDVDVDDDRRDDSTVAGSPAAASSVSGSKTGRSTARRKATSAGTELRRSNRKR